MNKEFRKDWEKMMILKLKYRYWHRKASIRLMNNTIRVSILNTVLKENTIIYNRTERKFIREANKIEAITDKLRKCSEANISHCEYMHNKYVKNN